MEENRQQRGLSLVELLFAISFLATMIFMLSSLTQNTLKKQRKLNSKNNLTQEINKVLDQISYDLSHAFIISSADLAKTGGSKESHTLFSITKGSPSDTLKMTYNGHQASKANSHESSHSYVVYKVQADPENKRSRNLYRGEFPRTPENFLKDPPLKIFSKHVHSIKFFPWNGERWLNDKWDSTVRETKNKLPKMIRVDVYMWTMPPEPKAEKQADPGLERFSTVVYLNQSLEFKELKTAVKRFKIS